MMQLSLSSIPLRGLALVLSASDEWFKSVMAEALVDYELVWSSLQAKIKVDRVEKNIHVEGDLSVQFILPCDRCAEPFNYDHHFEFTMDMVPLYKSDQAEDKLNDREKEVELSRDDLEFMYYEGEAVDLGEILREQCVLSLPSRFICSEACRGLCVQCGGNLNQTQCAHVTTTAKHLTALGPDSRRALLKN